MLQIGHLRLDFPVVQAALSGYSDGPMRLMARRHGAPYCIHEVVLDRLVVQPGKLRKQLLTLDDQDHPVGGQLMGADPARLAAAAKTMAAAGFDVVDINFGCPLRRVLGRCRGGFLLSEPSRAIEIIECVRDAVPRETPVTLKMRRGMDDSATSERDFFRIFDAAFDAGLAAVTVHGRTVKQRYAGPSDWQFIERAKRHAGDKTVLGSGDLFTADDIRRMLDQTGVDGVTVARGCIGNPWIFGEVRALLASEPLPRPPSVPSKAASSARILSCRSRRMASGGRPALCASWASSTPSCTRSTSRCAMRSSRRGPPPTGSQCSGSGMIRPALGRQYVASAAPATLSPLERDDANDAAVAGHAAIVRRLHDAGPRPPDVLQHPLWHRTRRRERLAGPPTARL